MQQLDGDRADLRRPVRRQRAGELIAELAERWGAEVVLVASPEDARLALAAALRAQRPFAALLTDYHMPEEDGDAFVARLQRDPAFASLPVVMMSSGAPALAQEDAHQGRYAAWLAKPVREHVLRDVLADLIDEELVAQTELAPPPAEDVPTRGAAVGRPTILLAEDNVVNQLVVSKLIGEDRFEVIVAPDGEAAVEAYTVAPPDLVLMDVSMPVMDGLEAARRIRQHEADERLPRVPIIALTAHVLAEDRRRCEAAGMDEFLSKPLRRSELDQVLADQLVVVPATKPATAA